MWENIGFINGNGTTTETKSYSYKDENLSAVKYQYRLKQIDFDGTFEYSNIVEAEILPPAIFSLEQNFPNPFNPSTKISWQSPVNSHQTLKIYDVLGNEVATLVNEYRTAGKYEAEFNANNLASGIYYYQLKVGEFVQTKKMVLIK
ncbi:MAG: T9SS type A sorting domain-containing protein [Ignavibacteriaceae bacterium]